MTRLFIVFICIAALHEQAFAYQKDVVSIHETTKDTSPAATFLMREAAVAIEDALLKDFPCLKVFTKGETKKALDTLKEKELIGPTGREWIDKANWENLDSKRQETSYEEETNFQQSIQKKIDELGKVSQAKYLIVIVANANPIVSIRITALNVFWTKKSGLFYVENKLYSSTEEALADIRRIADELVKAFVETASQEKWSNEVCPFKGNLEIKVVTQRKQQKEETFVDYCNGQNHAGRKKESLTGEGNQVWKLQRYGNPDTTGTMEGTMSEKIVREEITGCHECGSGRKGSWLFNDETETTCSVSGLDTSTYIKGESDNKDATVRLHFAKDGTYKVSVRAVSTEGIKYVTKSTTASGICDNLNGKPKKDKQPIAIPLEQQFGPFTGTVRDKRLKDKQVVKPGKGQTDEVSEYSIQFEFTRPDGD